MSLLDLLPKWPAAIDQSLICDVNNESQKEERAISIMNFFVSEPVKDKKFLDYGCGEGQTISVAKSQGANLAIGYDIVSTGSNSWDENDSVLFTNWDYVKSLGPFDVVLAYDVIDHADDPQKMISDLASVMTPNSTLYLLAHPWIGRHGGHLYQQFNYAFAHLVLNQEELTQVGIGNTTPEQNAVMPITKNFVVHPIGKYKSWINSQFNIVHSEVIRDPVEDFFKRPRIANRIIENVTKYGKFDKLQTGEIPTFQLEQSFHEFSLKLK